MGSDFKPTSVSLDAPAVRQLSEIDDAFSSNGRSFFGGRRQANRSDQIRTIVGWFHAVIFGGDSLDAFARSMQQISAVNAYQLKFPAQSPSPSFGRDGACAESQQIKIGPQRVETISEGARPGKVTDHIKREAVAVGMATVMVPLSASFRWAGRSIFVRHARSLAA